MITLIEKVVLRWGLKQVPLIQNFEIFTVFLQNRNNKNIICGEKQNKKKQKKKQNKKKKKNNFVIKKKKNKI